MEQNLLVPVLKQVYKGLKLIMHQVLLGVSWIKKNSFFLFLMILSHTGYSYTSERVQQIKQKRYAAGVVSITRDHDYFRKHHAALYWNISPYYLSQLTDASCSLASATMVINALRVPQMVYANQKLATSDSLQKVSSSWASEVRQGGKGVTLDQLGVFLKSALKKYHLNPVELEVIHATHSKEFATRFHKALLESEKTGTSFVIVNFDQKYMSGTKSIGHFSPVGAFDEHTKRILLMDPDREFFEPYWVPEQVLVTSMTTEDRDAQKRRGFILVKWSFKY